MANNLNPSESKLVSLDTDEIVSTSYIRIRKIFLIPGAEGDGVSFYEWGPRISATHDNYFTNLTITNTSTVTDAAAGGIWTGRAIGQWVRISSSSIAANDGWYYLKTATSANAFVVENSTNALTNGTGAKARIEIFIPELAITMLSDNIGGTGSKANAEFDAGDKGLAFPHGLSMQGITSSSYVYVYTM